MRSILSILAAAAVLFFAILPARSAESPLGIPPAADQKTNAVATAEQEPGEAETCRDEGDAATPPGGLEDIEKGLEQTAPIPGKSSMQPAEGERLLAALL